MAKSYRVEKEKKNLILSLVEKGLNSDREEEGTDLFIEALLEYTSIELVIEDLVDLVGYSLLSTLLEEEREDRL